MIIEDLVFPEGRPKAAPGVAMHQYATIYPDALVISDVVGVWHPNGRDGEITKAHFRKKPKAGIYATQVFNTLTHLYVFGRTFFTGQLAHQRPSRAQGTPAILPWRYADRSKVVVRVGRKGVHDPGRQYPVPAKGLTMRQYLEWVDDVCLMEGLKDGYIGMSDIFQ